MTKSNGTITVSTASPTSDVHSMVAAGSSWPDRRRVRIEATDQVSDDASTRNAAGWKVLPPGRITISTPTNPTAIAVQRRMPTISPSIGTDSAVINSGDTKPTAAASAIGRNRSAATKASIEVTIITPRTNCVPGLRTRTRNRPRDSPTPMTITTETR